MVDTVVVPLLGEALEAVALVAASAVVALEAVAPQGAGKAYGKATQYLLQHLA